MLACLGRTSLLALRAVEDKVFWLASDARPCLRCGLWKVRYSGLPRTHVLACAAGCGREGVLACLGSTGLRARRAAGGLVFSPRLGRRARLGSGVRGVGWSRRARGLAL